MTFPNGIAALVTGASRGIGSRTAVLLGELRANVALSYRDKRRRAEECAREVLAAGGQALPVQADLTVPSDVRRMFDQIRERLGRINLLVLNASGGMERDMPSDYAMHLNRDAQLDVLDQSLPVLEDGGRVVFVTSHLAHFHGRQPVPEMYEPVAASKRAGEIALRERIPELGERGISLVVVSGDLIEGTTTPKLMDRKAPGLIEARRNAVDWLPTVDDFAREIVLAATDPKLESGATVYVGSTES